LLKASFKLRILDLNFVNEFFVKRGNIKKKLYYIIKKAYRA